MEYINEQIRRLPAATGSIYCKWFLTICFLSVTLILMGVVSTGFASGLAIGLGALSVGLAVGMRETTDRCDI